MKTSTKKILYALIDATLVIVAVALSLRLLGEHFSAFSNSIKVLMWLSPVIAVPLFNLMGLHDTVIRHLSLKSIFTVFKSVTLFVLIWAAILWFAPGKVSASIPVLVWFCMMVFVGGSRVLRAWQFAYFGEGYGANKAQKNVLIYGAGTAGVQLATLLSYGNKHNPCGFIDDASDLQDRVVEGRRVYSSSQVQQLIDKYEIDEILMAIPSASRRRRKKILRELEPFPVHVRSLPSLEEIVNCEVTIDHIREVDMMDLLGRDPVPPDTSLLCSPIENKVVMVTGAAGSIGSELCRQIIQLAPSCVILFEQHEFSLYALSKDLDASGIKLVSILGSVLDQQRVLRIIKRYKVDTIYHAAAYKHVPMVEHNPAMGVLNNIVGTYNVARAACEGAVQNFMLISTDKAVRPTNIMGATKRVAELVIQAMDADCDKPCFSAVRFGNVIGSSGSVIPLFREQIRNGGPVTVTHRDITRYFMTISEAAQLVIQASALGNGGDVFVLDMGEPVKIDQMARHMIQLSGLTVADAEHPDGDIEIVYQGLRSGEKLYEELLIGENTQITQHSRIMCAQESSLPLETLDRYIDQLETASHKGDTRLLTKLLQEIVDGYQPHPVLVDVLSESDSDPEIEAASEQKVIGAA